MAAWTFILFLACSCSGRFKSLPSQSPCHKIAGQDQWDGAFAGVSGWTGGDVAASFIIPGNRALWVFGDSFIGEIEDGRRINSTLVNNTIAVHPYDPSHPGQAPEDRQVKYYWGPNDANGKPTAWVRPSEAGGAKTWYWPTGGGVVLPGPEDGSKLALFLIELEKKPGDNSVWGFQVIHDAVAMVDNVDAPVEQWRPCVREISADPAIEWGVAALMSSSPDYVLIYGTKLDASKNRNLVLGRVKPSEFENFSAWEFLGPDGQWLKSQDRAEPIVKGIASELSVDKITDQSGGMHLVMVYSEPPLGNRIMIRTSLNPEGPWSEAMPVFTVTETGQGKALFVYAAKGHAPLSENGTLLVSYIVNSNDFNELVEDFALYRPRFISVPLKALGIR